MEYNKLHTENIEYQCIIGLTMGLLFAPLGYSFKYSLFFIVLFELYVFAVTCSYPPEVVVYDRILINLFYLIGWIAARCIYFEGRNDLGGWEILWEKY